MDDKCHSLVFLKNAGYLTPMRTQLSFINVAKIKTFEKKILSLIMDCEKCNDIVKSDGRVQYSGGTEQQ